ncbi:hypothetical protein VAMP_269n36 [Candidatus Vampirococcus lugosii]|uniref:Uncharacterized protein n=1 Tax=Candidatus Vampirococcus lugosii TaxID=2789015 RepID=A0ABS5QMJ5_9BACT|nr:hypothetical protein [Candidatus Vampirococcus lugosii]
MELVLRNIISRLIFYLGFTLYLNIETKDIVGK